MAVIETRKQQDGTVTYRARVRLHGHPQRSQTFLRKSDARDWARQIEADMKRGRYLPTSEAARRTVADMVDRYTTSSLPRRSRNADATKTSALLAWWKKRLGPIALANVTPALIAECRDELLATPYKRGVKGKALKRSPATVNRYLAAISACFREAMREWHWLEQTPMPAVGRGPESRGVVRFLSDAELGRLLAASAAHSAPWLHPLVMLALGTGARRSELLRLKWADVDVDRGVITLHQTKNGERRAIPVAGGALRVLREWKDRSSGEPVFPGVTEGKPLSIESAWHNALRAAELADFRFHDLRHSTASYLAMSGATAPEIAAVLGHKTLQMVQRYAHLGEQHTAAVVTRMTEKFLPG